MELKEKEIDIVLEDIKKILVKNVVQDVIKTHFTQNGYNDVCANCPTDPRNGGSGVCCCSLPSLANPVT